MSVVDHVHFTHIFITIINALYNWMKQSFVQDFFWGVGGGGEDLLALQNFVVLIAAIVATSVHDSIVVCIKILYALLNLNRK